MRTVLLVENSPKRRQVMVHALAQTGLQVLPAGSGIEAISILQECPYRVELLIAPSVLVGEDAERLAVDVREERRGIKVLGFGYHMAGRPDAFLEEPPRPDELVRNAWMLLNQRQADRRGPPITGATLTVRERRRDDRRSRELSALEVAQLSANQDAGRRVQS